MQATKRSLFFCNTQIPTWISTDFPLFCWGPGASWVPWITNLHITKSILWGVTTDFQLFILAPFLPHGFFAAWSSVALRTHPETELCKIRNYLQAKYFGRGYLKKIVAGHFSFGHELKIKIPLHHFFALLSRFQKVLHTPLPQNPGRR